MPDHIEVRIITPERIVLSKKADSVTLPAENGEMQVMPGHAALFATIIPGQITVQDGEKTSIFASGTGFLEVHNDIVKVLVDSAEGNAEIDPAEAQRLIDEAEDKLKNLSNADVEERFAFESQLATARARIEVYARSTDDVEAQKGFSRYDLPGIKADDAPKNAGDENDD